MLSRSVPTNKGESEAKAAKVAAGRAITAAGSAGEEQYAAEELTKANDLMDEANTAFDAENYDDATKKYREAREWADKARQIALERQRELGILEAGSGPITANLACSLSSDVGAASIYFDFDKSNVRSNQSATLNAVASCLKANPSARIVVEGHSDERGANDYNLALGDRRANTVKRYLETKGISGLSTISYGEEKPADSGSSEAAWAKNRRAEFTIQ